MEAQTHRLGARLHPLTIEQNALTSFKSRTTLVPAFANTIGPALFLAADRIIGGADGVFGRGMQWQGLSLRMTLHHEPTPWIPSTYMPTLAGPAVLPAGTGRAVAGGVRIKRVNRRDTERKHRERGDERGREDSVSSSPTIFISYSLFFSVCFSVFSVPLW